LAGLVGGSFFLGLVRVAETRACLLVGNFLTPKEIAGRVGVVESIFVANFVGVTTGVRVVASSSLELEVDVDLDVEMLMLLR